MGRWAAQQGSDVNGPLGAESRAWPRPTCTAQRWGQGLASSHPHGSALGAGPGLVPPAWFSAGGRPALLPPARLSAGRALGPLLWSHSSSGSSPSLFFWEKPLPQASARLGGLVL